MAMMDNMANGWHARAHIRFLRENEGGYRRTAIYSGYRSTVGCSGQNNDAIITVCERPYLLPGDESEIALRFLRPDLVLHRLEPGMEFTLQEGSRVVATGRLLDVRK
jgi:translation elongation factor EF-Tu-like GTPase